MSSSVAKRFELVVLLIAAIAFAWIVHQVGLQKLADDARRVGPWFLVILGVELGMHLLNTAGLLACFPRDRAAIGFARGALVRFAGETVNMTTPTATVGGEVVKISLLSRFGPVERLTASVSHAYAAQMLGQMVFVALLLPIALPRLQLPTLAKVALGLCVGGGLAFALGFTAVMRAGPYGFVHRLLRRVGLGKEGGKGDEATRRMDEESRELARDHRSFVVSVAWFTLGWAYGIIELALISHALGLDGVSLLDCATVESIVCFWDAMTFFVPGNLGTREGGIIAVFLALGHPESVGTSVSLVRRGRMLFYAVLGLVALAVLQRKDTPATTIAAGPSSSDLATAGQPAVASYSGSSFSNEPTSSSSEGTPSPTGKP